MAKVSASKALDYGEKFSHGAATNRCKITIIIITIMPITSYQSPK